MTRFTPNTTVICTGIKEERLDGREFIPGRLYKVDRNGLINDEFDSWWTAADWADFTSATAGHPDRTYQMSDQDQKKDGDKMNPLLLEEDFVDQLMVINAVLQYGVAKYGQRGGWKTVDPDRYEAALARHRRADLRGEFLDEESGLPHWAHRICNELFLAHFQMGAMFPDEVDAMATHKEPPK